MNQPPSEFTRFLGNLPQFQASSWISHIELIKFGEKESTSTFIALCSYMNDLERPK